MPKMKGQIIVTLLFSIIFWSGTNFASYFK